MRFLGGLYYESVTHSYILTYFIIGEDTSLGKAMWSMLLIFIYSKRSILYNCHCRHCYLGVLWLSNVHLLTGKVSFWNYMGLTDPEIDLAYFWWVKWGKRNSLWQTNLCKSGMKLPKYLQAGWRNTLLSPERHCTLTGSSLAQTSRFLQQSVFLGYWPGPGLTVDLCILLKAKA